MNGNHTLCPECKCKLKLGGIPGQKQRVMCPKCQSKLWVVQIDPLELGLDPTTESATPKQKLHTFSAPCPECEQNVKLSLHVRQGQQVICKACDTALEVINLNPLELDLASMVDYKSKRQSKYDEGDHIIKKQTPVWK